MSVLWGTWTAVTPGQIIHFGGWMYRESGNGSVGYRLIAADANYNAVAYPGGFNPTAGTWQLQDSTYTVPATGVAYVRIYCQIYQPTVASAMRYDDAFFGDDVHYYFTNHLGSASVIANSSGVVEEESDYYPFGGERVITAGPNHYKFTGKERDAESGADYFGARHYAQSLGRFMQPDEVFVDQNKSDPQSWNLYAYVRNNPASNYDPDGRGCEQDSAGKIRCVITAEGVKTKEKTKKETQQQSSLWDTIWTFLHTGDKEIKIELLHEMIPLILGNQSVTNPIASQQNTIGPAPGLTLPLNVLSAILNSPEPTTTEGKDFDANRYQREPNLDTAERTTAKGMRDKGWNVQLAYKDKDTGSVVTRQIRVWDSGKIQDDHFREGPPK